MAKIEIKTLDVLESSATQHMIQFDQIGPLFRVKWLDPGEASFIEEYFDDRRGCEQKFREVLRGFSQSYQWDPPKTDSL